MTDTISWQYDAVVLLDQRKLPASEEYLVCDTVAEVADAIRWMVVRGAPAIGVAAAMGLALVTVRPKSEKLEGVLEELESGAALLRSTRPTAVNLAWALDRVMAMVRSRVWSDVDDLRAAVIAEANRMHADDVRTNRDIGRHGAELLRDGTGVLTHCNAGSLATAGYGTALGVIRAAVEQGKRLVVFADETRPFLQGARLTAWELKRDDIPVTVIVDGAAGHVLRSGRVQAVVVGADRIAANGDTANKIGTYSVAVLARENKVPFYVAAPLSTVDLSLRSGEEIPIEERDPTEISRMGAARVVPQGVAVYNPAFDVTPAHLIEGIITELGIARAPYTESLRELARKAETAGPGLQG